VFSCDDLRSALSDYLDGDLPAEIRVHLEQHLSECRICYVLYDSTRKTLRIVTDSGSFDLPESASERFVQRTMERLKR
jgi:predicted anti-sigma-YlaC factor YlaD